MYYQNIKIILLIMVAAIWLSACGTDVGGNEDKTKPSTTIDAIVDENDTDGEIIGTATIQWTTDEVNRSTVDIFLSGDAGETFETTIELNVPDTGEYVWDTNTVADCRTCRLRIIPTDVVGNIGDPAESEEDFIINNVPEVFGSAYLFDFAGGVTLPGEVGCNDILVVPFDKNLDIRTPIARDLQLSIAGDGFGSQASVSIGANPNEINVTLFNDDGCNSGPQDIHLHIAGNFNNANTGFTAASGVDVVAELPLGTITAKDTGRTAQPSAGIDIAPTFSAGTGSFFINATTIAVALGHLDGDTSLDAVIINTNGSGLNAVYQGPSFQTYAIGTQALGDKSNTSVALGDVDLDGDNDIIVGNSGGSLVFTNNGQGVMTLDATLTDTADTVTLADVDGDKDLDLIIGTKGSNHVWLNQGGIQGGTIGVYIDSGQALGSSTTKDLVLGDIDNDGDDDIVTANSGANRVWKNNGSGVFSEDTSPQTLGNATSQSIKLGDVDNDGDLDIVTGNLNSANKIWLNDGNGNFMDSGQSLGNGSTLAIAITDYDADGDIDIISGNNNNPNIVWINDGHGRYSAAPWLLNSLASNNTVAIAVGDIESSPDGDIDIIEGLGADNPENLWINNARTRRPFVDSNISIGNSDSQSISLGDIDSDGDNDMVVGNFGQPDNIYFNNGTGVFTVSSQLLDSVAGFNDTRAIKLGDVDADGHLDIVVGNDGQPNIIWINDGTGVFTDSKQTLGNSDTTSIVLIDIDGINGPDIISGNLNQPNRVWRNDGTGFFSEDTIPQTLGNALTLSISAGDLDGDNDIDLVAGNIAEPNAIWINNGFNTGIFMSGGVTEGSGSTRQIKLGDVDKDGDLDIIAANDSVNSLIRLNNGAAMFTDSGQTLIAGHGIQLIDYDADADLDIIIDSSSEYTIFKNRGDGIFGTANTSFGQPPSGLIPDTIDMATGDIDGDRDTDIVTAIGSGGANKVYLNDY